MQAGLRSLCLQWPALASSWAKSVALGHLNCSGKSELQPCLSLERRATETRGGEGCTRGDCTALCTNWLSRCSPLPSLQRPLFSLPWGSWEVLCLWTLMLN